MVEIKEVMLVIGGEEAQKVMLVDNGEEFSSGDGSLPNHDKVEIIFVEQKTLTPR